jgi:hypothetical protein
VNEFISEDDLKTFEGWLRYQTAGETISLEGLANWRKRPQDDHDDSPRFHCFLRG